MDLVRAATELSCTGHDFSADCFLLPIYFEACLPVGISPRYFLGFDVGPNIAYFPRVTTIQLLKRQFP